MLRYIRFEYKFNLMNDTVTDLYEQYYKNGGAQWLEERSTPKQTQWFIEHITSIIEERRTMKESVRVVDLGCGYGRICLELCNDADQLLGIDLSRELIGEAKRRKELRETSNLNFIVGDISEYIGTSYNGYSLGICLWSTIDCLGDDEFKMLLRNSAMYLDELVMECRYYDKSSTIENMRNNIDIPQFTRTPNEINSILNQERESIGTNWTMYANDIPGYSNRLLIKVKF